MCARLRPLPARTKKWTCCDLRPARFPPRDFLSESFSRALEKPAFGLGQCKKARGLISSYVCINASKWISTQAFAGVIANFLSFLNVLPKIRISWESCCVDFCWVHHPPLMYPVVFSRVHHPPLMCPVVFRSVEHTSPGRNNACPRRELNIMIWLSVLAAIPRRKPIR